MTAMNTLKWNKIGRDDYRSACGRFHICRLEAADNKYANRDEWTLIDGGEAVDVYSLLRNAKAAAVEIAGRLEFTP
jgi:hypothetical protein